MGCCRTAWSPICHGNSARAERIARHTRSGVSGSLHVTKDTFELDAKLGFLLGAFKDRIEGEIVKNLDALLAGGPAVKKPAAKKAVAKKKQA